MKKLFLLIFLSVFIGVSSLLAQTRVITGTITSATEGALPGVTVQVKGTTTGAVADANGKYSITVPQNATTLVFTYIGMKSQEVAITGRSVIDVVMESDILGLDEVVVTALGISRERKGLGYAVQDVKSEELTRSAQPNVISSLNGKIAGVQISQAGGQIGASSRVVIRGNSSLGDNQPLIVIDGVPVSNSALRQNNIDFGSGLYDVNPDDIESITVLKGGSAALYGMRAGHGVILITTKSGSRQAQGLTVTYDGNFNFDQVYSLQKMQNKYGQGYLGDEYFYKLAQAGELDRNDDEVYDEADVFTGTYQQFAQGDFHPGYGFSYVDGLGNGINDGFDESWGPRLDAGLKLTQYNSPNTPADWISHPDNIKSLYQLGHTTNHNIAVTSNSERSTTRASLGYRNQKGVLPNTDLTRYSINFNTSVKLGEMWDYDLSTNYTRSESDNLPMTEYNASNPMQSLGQWFGRQVDMKDLKAHWTETMENGYPYNWNSNYHNNPYWSLNKNTNSMEKNRLFGKTSLYFKPVSSVRIEGRLGVDYYNTKTQPVITYRSNEMQSGTGNWDGGSFDLYDIKNYEFNADLIGTFNQKFGDFDVSILAGANYRNLKYESMSVGADQLTVPDLFTIANVKGSPVTGMDHSWIRSNSVYGSANIGYKGMVYLEGSARNDWSSTIADPFFYPAFSLSWIPTETFNIDSKVLSFLKIRGGWAKVGSATGAYNTDPYFSAGASTINGVTQYSQSTQYPPMGLRPEQVVTNELGVETHLFNSRIAIDVSLYDKTTTDQILPVAISKATGYNTMLINAGEISNKGIEVQLRGNVFNNPEGFSWDITLNWSRDKSEIIDLYTDPVTKQPLASYNIGNQWSTYVQAQPGQPWGMIVGRGIVRRESDNAVILNSDGFPRTAANMNLGNVNPDWLAGIRNEFSFRGLSLGFLFDIRKGGDIFSVSKMFGAYSGLLEFTAYDEIRRDGLVLNDDFFKTVLGRDEKVVKIETLDGTDVQNSTFVENDVVIGAQDFFETYYSTREFSVYDGSFIKLRELNLSYRLPSGLFANTNLIRSGTVSLVGSNLAILYRHKTNISGLDPETSVTSGNDGVGLESTSYPPSRSMGVKLSFTF